MMQLPPVDLGNPVGTPEQSTIAFRPGVTAFVGCNPDLARFVGTMTGDTIAWPCRTLGFMDEEARTLGLVLHGFDAAPRRLTLSIVHDGLPLTRSILDVLAISIFDELRMERVITHVPASDLKRRDALQRLGLKIAGRDHGTGTERLTFVLTPDTLPAAYLRFRARRSH